MQNVDEVSEQYDIRLSEMDVAIGIFSHHLTALTRQLDQASLHIVPCVYAD